MSATPALFKPLKLGNIHLGHRVVLSPMTRFRADAAHVPTDRMVEYYKQRTCVPGTLVITEGVFVSPQAGGIRNVPGIYNQAQIAGWKKITKNVHDNGGSIVMQLWALGRVARPEILKEEDPTFEPVGPSPIALKASPENVPHALTKDEIKQYVQWYATAAANAIEAGFDGVEIHNANGYLPDQFLQDTSNNRTDEYGGSIENRARFSLEIIDAISAAVGENKLGVRFSPWNVYQDMRMENPIPTFTYVMEQLKEKHPQLAYLHVVRSAAMFQKGPQDPSEEDFIYKLWSPKPFISTGEFDRESALKTAEETDKAIGFGIKFLSNPDLPFRLRENLELNAPDMATVFANEGLQGYTTYPFHEKFLEAFPQYKA